MSEENVYYGVVQAYHGHDYVYIYTEDQIRKDFEGVSFDVEEILPTNTDDPICEDLLWPVGGSNVTATEIYLLKGDEAVRDFLTQEPFGPDEVEDPTLVEIAEYIWTIETDSRYGCTKEIVDRLGINADDYERTDPRVEQLKADFGIEDNDFYDTLSDVPISEVKTEIPARMPETAETFKASYKKKLGKIYDILNGWLDERGLTIKNSVREGEIEDLMLEGLCDNEEAAKNIAGWAHIYGQDKNYIEDKVMECGYGSETNAVMQAFTDLFNTGGTHSDTWTSASMSEFSTKELSDLKAKIYNVFEYNEDPVRQVDEAEL